MQVELLTNGGYTGTNPCVGKVFTATAGNKGYLISIAQLTLAGFESDGSVTTTLFFCPQEVRVLNDD